MPTTCSAKERLALLEGLYRETRDQFTSGELGVEILLPDDEPKISPCA